MTAASPNNPVDLADLLAFYASVGVDEALEDAPVNRFAEAAPKPAERMPTTTPRESGAPEPPAAPPRFDARAVPDAPAPRPPTSAVPDEAQAALARQLATAAVSLDELRQHMAAFEGCNLKATAKNLVFADGNPQAAVMLVGEAPGRDEDIEGLPFVGRSGRLLDRMLAAIGLDRNSAYIANVIPWRPPGNRTPTPHETEICRPFIERQIELVNPKVLINLGGPSAKTLLNTSEGILRLRGNWRVHTTASGIAIPAMPTLHPAYLLRTPAHKKLAWRDFLEVKAKLRALG
ncbi:MULTISPECIES: uracil-DNA glycosylase [unclassified Mesorhizobium]|uniref:uracil-DNA glycosylase n=1 Tax=unclassified Mesorhizobium TaxID=325217 RepID=UPI000FD9B385|nr:MULTISPECIES: uracil-DNA glycosylase [unclassified Mesorhizobium]RWC77553.1 MAG: uracil-DNA glycosylase [Mesorhizobium sp.]TGR58807.1 uracil-DNA glycosylase [bacterium M00.F.Ca.ET.199.01.1.1]TGU41081.1 uracil-DNA glycosylase [bacterium M00.F.Ca.ET.156.01.1.1]TGV90679.1 uracil-DNA glycosylase [Mesorhizobium sp. M00.F.Ca.ET.149.01.1.1]TGP95608.1 uracil-DNA glycosylase [Mesorhizobium sp. M8A.F.Ca.ET.218.01.1.1]